ncbi:MAG: dihydrodipicolinate synthase family protein [Saprospiraceae bacterium]|nr:dihydrodipicolinate synthase family protein [Saprospiraceae bacterium]
MHWRWEGIFPAVTTKFFENSELDLGTFELNIKCQIDAGVNGLVLGGTLGEASTLDAIEKERLVKRCLEITNGKIPVILNVAEGSTKEAMKQVRSAKTWGVQGIMLLPPMRYKPDHRETVAYFRTVAASTDLPIMIYNNPIDYKTEVSLAMFEDLSDCVNIQAVKESTRDITNVTRMINNFGDRYKILCGVDTMAMEELLMGASGWVAGLVCAFPSETVTIYRLIQDGRLKEAKELYRWFMPLLELDIHTKLVQYIKLAEKYCGIGTEYVREPRLTLIGEERNTIEANIKRAISARPNLALYYSDQK